MKAAATSCGGLFLLLAAIALIDLIQQQDRSG
jgi:hypothetical protein